MKERIPEEFVEKVRSNTNIVDVISNYVQLKKSGKNMFGYCPFHEERTGSFSVSEDKQIFHCFSCGRGGNVFSFIMDIENINFPESVLKVADMTGISIPKNIESDNSYNDNDSQYNDIQKLYEEAQTLYHHILVRTTTGEGALVYLQKRKLEEQTIDDFGIGFAPDKSDFLLTFFREKKIKNELLEKSGLFSQDENGNLYDRFRGRVMFPIKNQNGKTIAFSGRILDKKSEVAKYMNSPETLIFDKSKVLFNYDLAKKSVRLERQIILFEGFMDVISAYQAGITNGVASMGTSFTEQQIYLINRITDKIIICYDGDDPGQEATHRSLTLLRNKKLDIGVVILPNKMDPDEYIKINGSESFKKIIKNGTQTVISFELNRLSHSYNFNNDHDKLEFLDSALRELANISSAVEIDLYLQKLSDKLSISMEALKKQFSNVKREELVKRPPADFGKKASLITVNPEKTHSKLEIAQQNLLYLTLRSRNVYNEVVGLNNFAFVDDKYNRILGAWSEVSNFNMSISEFMDYLSDDLKPIIAELEIIDIPDDVFENTVKDYINVIMNNSVKEEYDNIKRELSFATENNDEKRVLELTNKMIVLKNKLLNLRNPD